MIIFALFVVLVSIVLIRWRWQRFTNDMHRIPSAPVSEIEVKTMQLNLSTPNADDAHARLSSLVVSA